MITVLNQAMPTLMPDRTLATMIQPHSGAQMSSSGTGSPNSQPATNTGFGPYLSARAPAAWSDRAWVTPKAGTNERTAVKAVSPEDLSGEQRQDRPLLTDHPAPTRPLTPTSSANWAAFSPRPSLGSRTVIIARVWVAAYWRKRATARRTMARASAPARTAPGPKERGIGRKVAPAAVISM